jgi:hypothetical protein
VNEPEEAAHYCRKLVTQRNGHWQLTNQGQSEIELLIQ